MRPRWGALFHQLLYGGSYVQCCFLQRPFLKLILVESNIYLRIWEFVLFSVLHSKCMATSYPKLTSVINAQNFEPLVMFCMKLVIELNYEMCHVERLGYTLTPCTPPIAPLQIGSCSKCGQLTPSCFHIKHRYIIDPITYSSSL